ncbi:Tim44/TimA family putative adaptor protein [Sphingomonas sp. BN140010]|uniref:Tim44/TimA family putative adaptor protein n=1 Tax=Sphingomonas arvum TaxID=2992113 RepID=A0ABT3JDY9_9SPHN|nr:Tim44/TimA family putative adaptor protein [Sphingomonas sp. BN140010]MCW3797285.1 Tim44/TimA family putative adaptor protein [Sphingomonas sp. BN140010]
MVSIIILALVALFIGLRLYSVLGERTGHEQQLTLKPAEQDATVAPRPQPSPLIAANPAEPSGDAYLPTAGPGVRAILSADSSFDVARFLEGAQSAYRMILEAFWRGELDDVRGFIDPEVYATFATAVEERNTAGHRLDNRLVAIEHSVIAAAALDRSVATVTVRFEADIAAVTRDAAGEVVAGSLSDAVQTRDKWTFRRDLASRDPNWILIETDEEE